MPETLASQTLDATSLKLYFTAVRKLDAAVKSAKATSPEIAAAFTTIETNGGTIALRNAILSGGDASEAMAELSSDNDFMAALDVVTQAIYQSLA